MFNKKKGQFSMKRNTIAAVNKNKQRPVGVANKSRSTVVGVASK